MPETTPVEQELINALTSCSLDVMPQYEVGELTGTWWNEDEDEWVENEGARYYIDLFLEIGSGLAIEVDDYNSHHTYEQLEKDRIRESYIRRYLGCDIMRVAARDVSVRLWEIVEDVTEWVAKELDFELEECIYVRDRAISGTEAWRCVTHGWRTTHQSRCYGYFMEFAKQDIRYSG